MANAEDGSRSQRPLLGVIICCTSIPPERRADLAAVASQMGAVNKLDLTSDVTHLIVGDTDTPKYKYVAKERPDVKCLLPEWVEAVRDSWMEGGETDVDALEKQLRLPTLFKLRICVTGFEDLIARKQIEEAVKTHGGEYRGDLTKEVSHLVALKPTGNKYNFARLWGIKVVSIEWLQQSLERGMILDESLFDPLLDESQRGRDAWVRRTTSTSSLNKRPREGDVESAPPRKLRRTASAKFSSQNESIWGDIVGGGFGPSIDTKDPWDERQRTTIKQSDLLSQSSEGEIGDSLTKDVPLRQPPSMTLPVTNGQGIFWNKCIALHGFTEKETTVLKRHLQSHGAQTCVGLSGLQETESSSARRESYLLVPYTTPQKEVPSIPDSPCTHIVVTNLWVEQCLSRKKFVQPTQSVMNQPFQFPLAGFENFVVSSTAFENMDLLHLSQLIKLLGATYDEYLTPNTAALICNDTLSTREKLKAAWAWNIPAVRADWLWACVRAGKRQSFEHYLLRPPAPKSNEEKKISSSEVSKPGSTAVEPAPPKRRLFHRTLSEQPAQQNPTSKDRTTPDVAKDSPKKDPAQNSITAERINHDDMDQICKDSVPPVTHDQPCGAKSSSLSTLDQGSSHILGPPSSHTTIPPNSHPLQEVSPNTSPKRSPTKNDTSKNDLTRNETEQSPHKSSILTTANVISNHLAALRRPSSSKSTETPALEDSRPSSSHARPGRPTKRKLFGRATSNLSAKSAGSADFSRAGSVDTMNSEGMGTPLEVSLDNTKSVANTNNPLSGIGGSKESKSSALADVLKNLQEGEEVEKEEERVATQIVYEEPEARAWRERLAGRLGGKKGRKEEGEGRREEEFRGGVVDETVGVRRSTRRGGR